MVISVSQKSIYSNLLKLDQSVNIILTDIQKIRNFTPLIEVKFLNNIITKLNLNLKSYQDLIPLIEAKFRGQLNKLIRSLENLIAILEQRKKFKNIMYNNILKQIDLLQVNLLLLREEITKQTRMTS